MEDSTAPKLADLTASQPRNPNFEYVTDADGNKTNVVRTTTTQDTDGNDVKTRVTRTPDKTKKIMYAAAIKLYAAYMEEVMALRVRAFWILHALLSRALKAKVHGHPR